MRLALVIPAPATEPSEGATRLQAEAQQIASELRGEVELELFSEVHAASVAEVALEAKALSELQPKAFDRILYLVGDHPGCAFMLSSLARSGGIVLLLDWELGRVTRKRWPELDRPGIRGYLRALAVGGFVGARERLDGNPALNRPVIRLADGFIVRDPSLGDRIVEERNMPTPVACVDEAERVSAGSELGARYAELLELFPSHPAVRLSLIQSAIKGADEARAQREREEGV